MQFPLRFFSDTPHIDFMGKRWIAFALTAAIILGSIGLVMTKGLAWGLDFTGGVLVEMTLDKPADLAELREKFPSQEFGEAQLQNFGSDRQVMLRLEQDEKTDQAALVQRVRDIMAGSGYQVSYDKIEFVGPTVGEELVHAGVLAMVLSIIGIMIYVWVRFEWQFSIGAAISLIHDLIAVIGFYALSGYEFNLSSVAAILTVLGYSINDSVIIFDRVRELRRKFKKMPFTELLNTSINMNLGRTLLVSGTTVMSVLALVLLGGEVIEGFAAAILFGVVIGTFSSIYVSVPVLIYFPLDEDRPRDTVAVAAH